MIKKPVSFDYQGDDVTGAYIERSIKLLEELHVAIDSPGKGNFVEALKAWQLRCRNDQGEFLREAMFYGSESAFSFQYIDLAREKYRADATWLLQNKGFTIEDAYAVVSTITRVQHISPARRAFSARSYRPQFTSARNQHVRVPRTE